MQTHQPKEDKIAKSLDIAPAVEQAKQINSWGSNVYVKVPYYNSKGNNNLKIIKILSSKGVKLNITAIFQLKQIKNILTLCF